MLASYDTWEIFSKLGAADKWGWSKKSTIICALLGFLWSSCFQEFSAGELSFFLCFLCVPFLKPTDHVKTIKKIYFSIIWATPVWTSLPNFLKKPLCHYSSIFSPVILGCVITPIRLFITLKILSIPLWLYDACACV